MSDAVYSNYYKHEHWLSYLKDFLIDKTLCEEVIESMTSFSGQYTRMSNPFALLENYKPESVSNFVRNYLRGLDGPEAKILGLKETWCEEYIPYLLRNGFKSVLIIRDPRDVICSLNYGQGRNYGGRLKPSLFNIRSWRKSVAFSLAMQCEPDFLAIKYEDLVNMPGENLNQVFNFVSVKPPDINSLIYELSDQQGKPWQSNSSHVKSTGVTNASVGKYRELLPQDLIRFIEACCFFEMRVFGYACDLNPGQIPDILRDYSSNEQLERPELESFCWSNSRCDEEILRWELVQKGDFNPRHFIFKRAFDQLIDTDLERLAW